MSRLRDGHVMDGPTNGGLQRFQTYGFDPFGNLNSIGGDPWAPGRSTPTSPASNHLTGGTYDGAGNLTAWQGNTYSYDALGMMTRSVTSGEDRRFIYTAGDERLWSFLLGGSSSTWALRDLDGRVLREYEPHVNWATAKDYVYRDGQLLATSHPAEGVRHLHLDHLGTPRLVSGTASAADGFYTLTPCRVLDTRTTSAPIQAGETRIVQMSGTCGIPPNAAAVSVNLTVDGATAAGELTAMPATAVAVPESTAISYPASTTRANNAVLMLGNGALGFYSRQPAGNVHLLVDVNGYFVQGEGSAVAYHAYFPFGEELTSPFQDTEQMKLTGHERDINNPGSVADDLDYMHARFCSPLTARFLSVDPKNRYQPLKLAQLWNRYAYAAGNPVKFVDPDGEEIRLATGGNAAFVTRLMVATIQRPTGRAVLGRFAASRDFTLTFKEGQFKSNAASRSAIQKGQDAKITFGQTTPVIQIGTTGRTNTGATIQLDSSAISDFHKDRSGLTTFNHEGYHAMGFAGQFPYDVVARGDKPSNDTGPANAFGELIASEQPDLTEKEAERLLKMWLTNQVIQNVPPP